MDANGTVTYLRVPNWERYQEKRTTQRGDTWRPPWIKVYCDSSLDYELSSLSIRQRGLLVEIWKLAGRLQNRIPQNPQWIARAVQTDEEISKDLDALLFAGFLERSDMITEGLQKDVALEERRVEENNSANAESHDEEIRVIFDHWVSARSRTRARLTEGRKTKIKARLKHFTAAELVRALDAVALDKWPDRDRHDDLAVLFKNDEAVERWLRLADMPPEVRGMSAAEITAMGNR